jgi:Xaa-Pro aminopeptidase
MRAVKDENELERLRMAARVGDETFSEVLKSIKPGRSELKIASIKFHFFYGKRGAPGKSFDTIVWQVNMLSASRASGSKSLLGGDMVTMDFGGFIQALCRRYARTIALQ